MPDVIKTLSQAIERGGLLTQRGILGALYFAAVVQLLLLARITQDDPIVGLLASESLAPGAVVAVCSVVFGLVIVHVLFELFVAIEALTIDQLMLVVFRGKLRSKLSEASCRKIKYSHMRKIREYLLSGEDISEHAETEIRKLLLLRMNLSYLATATLGNLIFSLVAHHNWSPTYPRVDNMIIGFLSVMAVLNIVAQLRRSYYLGKYLGDTVLAVDSAREKLEEMLPQEGHTS